MEIFKCMVCGNTDQDLISHFAEDECDKCLACGESLVEVIDTNTLIEEDDDILAEKILKENDNGLFY